MHGLINHSFQRYMCDSYGQDAWLAVAVGAGVSPPTFEPMLTYDDAITPAVLDAMAAVLHRTWAEVMEDIGAHLVSHPKTEAVRRLLRFGGMNFEDFLHSLDDLPDRARLEVLSRTEDLTLYSADAQAWAGIAPLAEAGFLVVSQNYAAFLAGQTA